MTISQRIEDIVKRSGLSEHIVRSVLRAERDSIVDSLKRGERATMVGRCTLIPNMVGTPINIDGNIIMRKNLKAYAKPVQSLSNELKNVSEYIKDSESENVAELMKAYGIEVLQIKTLE